MEAAKKSQQPPTPEISRAEDWRTPLSDLTNDLTPLKGRPPRAAACQPRTVSAGDGDAPGTRFIAPLGLDSVPSCRVASSSGIGIRPVVRNCSESGPTWKCKGKEVANSSAISPNRMSNNDVSDVASSRQALFLPFPDDYQVKATEEDALGTGCDLTGLDSTPSRDVPSSSSGRDFDFQTTYRRRNSKGKEMSSSSASSHIRRSSRIRKRPGEVDDRAISKSCIIPSKKIANMSSTEVGERAMSKSCSLPNKRRQKQLHPPANDMEEVIDSLREFIRQQKSYFAEVDAFELLEEEASDDESE
ncbi:hypothetical protein MLD38_038191 [Melastoma candidum]|uniref:Uncharacterized protein n=1 Tax=Melastoma candidum TaxID=119954 RepID=A0ACB9KZ47_9MYRT|nr:hypothetical protein MLD38_038191 [Melastoma candidum]